MPKIDQVSTILREIVSQATGQKELEALNTDQLLSIAHKSMQSSPDPVIGAISQVITRTIFSDRKYKRKFSSIARSEESWGNIVRKITILDDSGDITDNPYIPLTDGESVDQYAVRKPKAMELVFTDQKSYEVEKTIFDTQLNTAFNSAQEFAAFIASVFTYVNNKIEKVHEETARATVSGYIAGKIAGDTSNVIHLLTEYNALTGLNLTNQSVYEPENFAGFMRWVYSRINGLSNLMTEYSIKFHTNLSDGVVMRHTPKDKQRLYLFAPAFYQMTSRVMSSFTEDFLKLPGAEMVNFWQNIDEPDAINIASPKYLSADGSVASGVAVNQTNVFGVLFDYDALGYSPILTRATVTPYNAKGEYRNYFWKYNERYFVDFTENGVVFLMD